MVNQLAKPGADIIAQLTPCSMHLLHMSVGISGEAGELLEAVLDCENIDSVDVENVTEELGDFEFYLEGFRQEMGVKRENTVDYKDTDFSKHGKSMLAVHLDVARLAMHSGKLLDEVKKMAVYVKPINAKAVVEDLKSIELCIESVRQHFGITHKDTLEHNVNKLGKRYKGHNYSNEQAQDRADKDE